jgi:predicted Zn-dependent protease
MTGNVNNGGKLTVSFSVVDSPGQADLIVARCNNDCIVKFNSETGKNFVVDVAAFHEGKNISFNRLLYDASRQTLQHEAGHYLGLQHQANAKGDDVGSIMSYSRNRAILSSDRQRLYDGYFYTLRDLRR